MRVLVTGMGGELGTRVAQLLEERDELNEIAGFDIWPPRRRLRRSEFHRIEPHDQERITEFVHDFAPEIVIHYGVYEPDSRLGGREAAEASEACTVHTLTAAAETGRLERLAVRSGLEVYGRGRGRPVVPAEDAPPEIRKRVTVNGLPRRATSIGDTVRVVLFRPEEMLLLVGAPSERRRFLDAILAQRHRSAARDLAELARILAQRNALLRAIRREEATPDNLAFWDEQLALVAARVMAARLTLIAELEDRIPALHDAVAPVDELGEQVRLEYMDTLKDAWPERP